MFFISDAFAQSAPAAATSASPFGGLMQMAPLVLMFIVLYFFMIRPQMKRQKEHKAMLSALAKGDEVVISGGILGRVSELGEQIVQVEVSAGTVLSVQRPSIVQVLPKGSLKAA